MKAVVSSPVSPIMQESFGCAVMNRFEQLLDDEADPFDILREAEADKKKKKKKEEKKGSGNAAKSGKRESQKDRKIPVFLGGDGDDAQARSTMVPGQKRPPRGPGLLGQNENRGMEVKVERSERRVVFRERRPNELEAPQEFSVEKPLEQVDRGMRGRGGGRGGMRGRGGRGGGFPRNFDGFDQRGKREFERHSGSDRAGIRPEEKRGGNGSRNWGSVKDEMRSKNVEMEQSAPNEEAGDAEEAPDVPEADPENR
ncbi:HABP4 protein, partial [Amia calva]|nr:HABP4 protein [Amia calva]